MTRKKLLYVFTLLLALCMLFAAGCKKEEKKPRQLTSDLGITVSGPEFDKGVTLVTERLSLSEERVKKAIKKLPEAYFSSDDADIAAIDIYLVSNGQKIQPEETLMIDVPAPIQGVEYYKIFQAKDDAAPEKVFTPSSGEIISFYAETLSLFLFRNDTVINKLTMEVEDFCDMSADIESQYFSDRYSLIEKIERGEKKSIDTEMYSGQLKLSASIPEDYKFSGWFECFAGVIDDEPISTDEIMFFTAKGNHNIVARAEAKLEGAKELWCFPGTSNFPEAFEDGRAATEVFVRTGNPQKIDVGKLAVKILKEAGEESRYVLLPPHQYNVIGQDALDFNKEGDYRVGFVAKGNENLATEVVIHVSEKIPNLRAFASYGGRFRVGNNQEHVSDKTFVLTGATDTFRLEAYPFDDDRGLEGGKMEFDGWYRFDTDGGILGEKLSSRKVYELNGNLGDLTVIALFRVRDLYSSLRGVYQLWLFPGESGIPADESSEKGELETLLYYRPNEAKIDVFRVEVKGLRRTADGRGTELIPLYYGDYEIDYDGLDLGKEGTYNVKFKSKFRDGEPYYRTISISIFKEYAALTVEFDGNGSLKGSIVEPVSGTSYGKTEMTESGKKYVFGAFRRGEYREIVATPDEGYKFVGWYSVDENGNVSEEPLSLENSFKFKQEGKDVHIKAVFAEAVKSLTVICEGFEYNNFNYSPNDKVQADLSKMAVITDTGRILDKSEYAVDASNVDYSKTGTYEITVTYKYDESVKTTLTVIVPQAETYTHIEQSSDGMLNGVIEKNGVVVVKDPDGYQEMVDLGVTITRTAVPDTDYRFDGWYIVHDNSGNKKFYSANATETFTINEDTYIYAKFAQKGSVSLRATALRFGVIQMTLPDGTVLEDNMLGVNGKEGDKFELTAKTIVDYAKFVGWFADDECKNLISSEATYTVTVNEDTEIYAKFEPSFTVTAIIEGGGEFVEHPSETELRFEDLPDDSRVSITVREKEGYDFVGWFDAVEHFFVSGEREYVAKVYVGQGDLSTGNLHLVARFRKSVTELKLDKGEDSGFYTDEEGVFVTEYKVNTGDEFYAYPERVAVYGKSGEEFLQLVSGREYTINSTINYGDDGKFDTSKEGVYTVTYTYVANQTIKATITIKVVKMLRFNVMISPQGSGYFTENGQEVDLYNGRNVENGTEITLTAVPYQGMFDFVGWFDYSTQTPVLISDNAQHTFTVNDNMTVLAKFEEKPSFIAFAEGDGTIKQNGEKAEFGNGIHVEKGTQITLTAEPNNGVIFVGWFDYSTQNPELISSDLQHTFTVNERMVVLAKFRDGLEHISARPESGMYFNGAYCLNVLPDDQYRPEPAQINVFGYRKGTDQEVQLVLNEDFTIDDGGLNYDVRGVYTVTYTAIGQPDVYAKVIVRVLEEGDYIEMRLSLPNDIRDISEDGEGSLIAGYVMGKPEYDLTASTFYALVVGQEEGKELVYGEDFTIDYGGLNYNQVGRYEVKFIPKTCPEFTAKITIAVHDPQTVQYFTSLVTADSGFTTGNYEIYANYKIGDEFKPNPEEIQVYGILFGSEEAQMLTLGTHYVVDKGNLNYEVAGEYEVVFRAVGNPDAYWTVKVTVTE